MAVDEMQLNSEKYYIYRGSFDLIHPFSLAYWNNLKVIVDAGDVESLKIIMKNQARLIILTEKSTQDILLVLACINDYMQDFTGYQYFRIVS